MADLFGTQGNGMKDAGLEGRAAAAFGMFEESAFGDIGDIWAFFDDGVSGWAEEDAFSAFMSDRGLPVEEVPVRATPIQSIADLAVAVRLETERLAALPRAPLPERRALPVSAPIRRHGKKTSATGGLFDALAPSAPVLLAPSAPSVSVGGGPVFPSASLFIQEKPRAKTGRSAKTKPSPLAPITGSTGPHATPLAVLPAPSARPVSPPPRPPSSATPASLSPRKPSAKKAKGALVAAPAATGGGLLDLLSTLAVPVPADLGAPVGDPVLDGSPDVAPPDMAIAHPLRAPAPDQPQESVPLAEPSVDATLEASAAPADGGDSESFEIEVDVSSVEEVAPHDDALPTPPHPAAPVLASPGVVPGVVDVAVPAPLPAAPVLAGRPMPARSRAAQVERVPAPYPVADTDRVDFSQSLSPVARPAAKGWPSKRDPSAPRPSRPVAAPSAAPSHPPVPDVPSVGLVAMPSVAKPALPVPPSETDIVDFFAEFDGLWDGDES
jgi:hypothetical protein